MNKSRTLVGAHAFGFLEGAAFTVPANGTAGRTAKPGSADTGWFDFGVSDWAIVPKNVIEDFDAPSPGARVLYDRLTKRKGLALKGKLMELSNLVYQMMMASTLPVSGVGGQYNPLDGDPVVRMWLQLQQFNQANTLINTMDVFVAMEIPGEIAFATEFVDVDVEANVLFSTLNTGTLA